MSTRSHVGVWLALFMLLFFATPVMRNGESMEAFVRAEMAYTRATFGDDIANRLQKKAGVVFTLYTPGESLDKAVVRGRDMELTRLIAGAPGVAAAKGFNSYIQGLILNLFVIVQRMFIFLLWSLILLPVFIAAAIDGFVQRAIKRAEFGAIRPAAYTVTSIVVVPLAMAPLIYLVIPLPVSPLISIVWALVMILPLSLMVSNMQPMFGRS
jgi:uncharacterized protein DUF4400